jgi:hypothetical protein
MIDRFSKQACLLTYLGILPFLMCTITIFSGWEQANAVFVLRAYAAVIISFISGIHWGIGMKDSQHSTVWLLATSNIISLLAWGCLLIHQVMIALMTLTLLFVVLLLIDNRLYKMQQIELWFIKLRRHATFFVALCLISSIARL